MCWLRSETDEMVESVFFVPDIAAQKPESEFKGDRNLKFYFMSTSYHLKKK